MDETIYKIAIAGFLHDIGKFAERAKMNVIQDFIDSAITGYCPKYQERNTHIHAAYTASFIDHIEKLLPKQFNKGNWGLSDDFMNLAAGHHKPETPLQWVIAIADRVSSGFDRDEFEEYNKGIAVKDYKKTRLLTIFEQISTDGKWRPDNLESFKFRYPLKELSPDNIFPKDDESIKAVDSESASKEYEELFKNFIFWLKKLEHKKDIPLWFEHFDSLFMVYASHIPAATVGKVVPDVSLYDHSKMTSAMATAIYLYHKDNLETEKIKDYRDKKFLLITGDFYGIQDFIFAQGGSTNKASAKLLRGRSFAVSLISELAADMLCREIGLPHISVILNAAGKFTILAPNTKETAGKIKEVEDKINEWLIKWFYGETSIGISSIEASCDDFVSQRFPDLWERLSKELEQKKHHKIKLEKCGGVINDYLDTFYKGLCPFCGKRPAGKEAENDGPLGNVGSACKICRDHIYLGTSLVKENRLAVTTVDADIHGDKLLEPIFGKYQVSLDVTGKLSELAGAGTLLKYWDISISPEGEISKNITARFINGYVPKYTQEDENDMRLIAGRKSEQTKLELIEMIKQNAPKSFLHIAKKSLNTVKMKDKPDKYTGIEALGILKADVDNLGPIFTCGLKRQSLSRLATLSRQMNGFFTIYLPWLLATKEEFKDIYTVFAGGDDLFLIGSWNRVIEFASFLHQSFQNYVCENTDITISAGISLNKPGEPVRSLYENSESALKKSKNNNRDSVTLFEQSVKWRDFNELEEIKKTIQDWHEKETINNAMLFRFTTFAQMSQQEKTIRESNKDISMEDLHCLKWRALFKYTIARNVGKNLKGNEKTGAIEGVEKSSEWIETYGSALKIPLWQIIYNQRKGG